MKRLASLACLLALIGLPVGSIAVTELTVELVPLHNKDERLIKVPARALVYRNGIPGVFVAQDGEARFRMVRTGKQTRKTVTVLSGLFGDETLVLSDPKQLYDGMPLNTDRNTTTP